MKRFFERLLGTHADPEKRRPANVPSGLVIESYSHNLVRIPQLDFFGPHAASPNGQYHLIWLDRNPEGTIGGHRQEGHGSWALMGNDGERLADGRLERPQDGHVADDGTFILSDWLFGDDLKSRLIAYGVDGQQLVQREFSANMASTGLSRDGGYAICQTANAPGSPDSCRYFLFDLSLGQEIASWVQETGWAGSYDFDTENRCVHLIGTDGERIGYTFDGTMVDRQGWQARRIAAGDLNVIRPIIEADGAALAPQLREAILAGLSVAIASDEVWQQARALRLQGEVQEQTGDVDAAIDSYEKALTIDPQVGVSRRLAKLQKARSLKTGAAPATKVSRFEQQARRLGIEHELVPLERGNGKAWRMLPSDPMGPVEVAALDHYTAQGWSGVAAEGGLMLTLLKAASFDALPARHADTFIEALYAQNVAFPEDRFEHGTLLQSVSRASRAQIERNWKIIAATAGETPAFYPAVRAEHVFALFDQLGPRRLRDVAELFARAPYDLRAGWPDLTLWRDGEIRFVEVKAPGDSMHASQARLISTILLPLSFRVGIAEVRPA